MATDFRKKRKKILKITQKPQRLSLPGLVDQDSRIVELCHCVQDLVALEHVLHVLPHSVGHPGQPPQATGAAGAADLTEIQDKE